MEETNRSCQSDLAFAIFVSLGVLLLMVVPRDSAILFVPPSAKNDTLDIPMIEHLQFTAGASISAGWPHHLLEKVQIRNSH